MFPVQLSDMGSGVFILQSSGNMFTSGEFIQANSNSKADPRVRARVFVVLQEKP